MSIASSFVGGFALSAGLIVAIGAQNVFVLRQGLKREHVAAIVIFCAMADFLLVAAGVAGIGAILGALPWLALVLTLGGAAFLLSYALRALRQALSPGSMRFEADQAGASLSATLGRAAAFTFLNPHVYLDTLLLMGAVGGALPGGGRASFVAGAGAASLSWFAALGFGARFLTPLFARQAAWRVLDGIIAAIMLVLAGFLLARALGSMA